MGDTAVDDRLVTGVGVDEGASVCAVVDVETTGLDPDSDAVDNCIRSSRKKLVKRVEKEMKKGSR